MSWVFKNDGWVEEPGVGFSLGVGVLMNEDAHLEAQYEDRFEIYDDEIYDATDFETRDVDDEEEDE